MNTPDTPTPGQWPAHIVAEVMDLERKHDIELCSGEHAERLQTLIAQLERELTAAKEELAATKELLVATQSECLGRAMDLDNGADREIALEDTIAQLRTESQEQARLLGMSGEREADLRGEIERLRRRVEAADEVMELAVKCASNERWNIMNTGLPLDWYGAYLNYYGAYRATEGKKP